MQGTQGTRSKVRRLYRTPLSTTLRTRAIRVIRVIRRELADFDGEFRARRVIGTSGFSVADRGWSLRR
ncbi:hypothetical protein AOB60_30830 [Streptomyces noursei]|uniref:Uncharacterized protein n=1 Tax=Streptomyces noursei TaxID=1971 RepID=A0A2N8PBN4_STRNR|nr:hypothetical protein AOB60_30830 [Streptomyces noursei]